MKYASPGGLHAAGFLPDDFLGKSESGIARDRDLGCEWLQRNMELLEGVDSVLYHGCDGGYIAMHLSKLIELYGKRTN